MVAPRTVLLPRHSVLGFRTMGWRWFLGLDCGSGNHSGWYSGGGAASGIAVLNLGNRSPWDYMGGLDQATEVGRSHSGGHYTCTGNRALVRQLVGGLQLPQRRSVNLPNTACSIVIPIW
ncbi:hypothetical protein SASPL_148173 [Salvia splendens]|uniref:Uncharacterized protein n=1 Tax=Salvia splendens TaxID=180675 RepID=A0A8X8W9S8_SALSN|nr:hypothetical protein SASPL_148173 [Salvia splendens]